MKDITQLINETKKYLTKYDYEKVIKNCDKILEIESNSKFGLRFKGISYYHLGKTEEGLRYYEKLYGLNPEDEDTIYSIAKLYGELGNYNESLKYYDKLYPSKHIISKKKEVLTKMKEYNRIIEYYNRKLDKIKNYKNTTENIKRKIVYLEEKGVFQYRKKDYNESLKTFKNVSNLFTEYKELLPDPDEQMKWYCLLDDYLNNYSDSQKFFYKFFNIADNRQIWYDKIKLTISKYEDSLVFCDLLMELEPDNVELLEICGKETRYIDDAYSLKCYKKILEISPENTNAIKQILNINSHFYSKDKSLKLINSKLYIKEIKIDLLVRKIKILESMTLYSEAIETYDEYLNIKKPNGLINHPLTVFDKIRCMEQQAYELYSDNEYKKAYNVLKEVSYTYQKTKKDSFTIPSEEWMMDEWYNKILKESLNKSNENPTIFFHELYKINKNTIDIWIEKINFLISWKHFGNPINYCNLLLDQNPKNVKLLLAKAYVYYRTKMFNEAIETYEKVLTIDSDNVEAKNYYFNILVKLKRYEDAFILLKNMKIDYNIIKYYLENLADSLFNDEKYDDALICYEIISAKSFTINIIDKIKLIWNITEDNFNKSNSKYYMDWIDLIKGKHESNNCPTCGNNLIPIVYGYPTKRCLESADKGEILLGGCCVSADSPMDYCKHCKKEIHMGIFGLIINQEDYYLYHYTRSKVLWISQLLIKNPSNNTYIIKKLAYKNGFDRKEFDEFIEKLEDVKFIENNPTGLKLFEGYENFNQQFY